MNAHLLGMLLDDLVLVVLSVRLAAAAARRLGRRPARVEAPPAGHPPYQPRSRRDS